MPSPTSAAQPRRVALLTLGCARNEVDSEELAGRLADGGFELVEDAADADVAVVNTCGFVAQAKKDSIDAVLAAADAKGSGRTQAVVAVGCLAERYGSELADALPEADAVLGFDDYADIAGRLDAILHGDRHVAHTPTDRRRLLPVTPVERSGAAADVSVPGHATTAVASLALAAPDLPVAIAPASGPRPVRRRLGHGPAAPLKIASGCDRRCAFCAIPSFRGSFVSRRPTDVLAEARWLAADEGVREVVLVSENSTSYGKDLGDLRLLETLLGELAGVEGLVRVRASYLQPAEMRPSLVDVLTSTPGLAAYFDLSFQHASGPLLRRMRRFGDIDSFLGLITQVRERRPDAGVRTNVIVGFPGETEADLAVLCDFLDAARLDTIGVFGYSDEDGTEAEHLDGHLDDDEVAARVEHVSRLVEELTSQRAEDRVGQTVDVLVESVGSDGVEGRAEHQAPEVDGSTTLLGAGGARVGDLVRARVVGSEGVDLVAEHLGPVAR